MYRILSWGQEETYIPRLIYLWLLLKQRNRKNYLNSSIMTQQKRQWHPTPVLLPEKSHGWRSLVGCSPWGREESNTIEWLHFHCSLSCIGEGNGNPLQCSCLENPRDGGAWWAALYGVAQSRTQLKWLSIASWHRSQWVSGPPGLAVNNEVLWGRPS